jgi:hypothetical protein
LGFSDDFGDDTTFLSLDSTTVLGFDFFLLFPDALDFFEFVLDEDVDSDLGLTFLFLGFTTFPLFFNTDAHPLALVTVGDVVGEESAVVEEESSTAGADNRDGKFVALISGATTVFDTFDALLLFFLFLVFPFEDAFLEPRC